MEKRIYEAENYFSSEEEELMAEKIKCLHEVCNFWKKYLPEAEVKHLDESHLRANMYKIMEIPNCHTDFCDFISSEKENLNRLDARLTQLFYTICINQLLQLPNFPTNQLTHSTIDLRLIINQIYHEIFPNGTEETCQALYYMPSLNHPANELLIFDEITLFQGALIVRQSVELFAKKNLKIFHEKNFDFLHELAKEITKEYLIDNYNPLINGSAQEYHQFAIFVNQLAKVKYNRETLFRKRMYSPEVSLKMLQRDFTYRDAFFFKIIPCFQKARKAAFEQLEKKFI